MSIWGAGVIMGPIFGPVLGGWLTESFNWRWVFIVNLPVGVIAAVLLLRYLPGTERLKRKFDLFGFTLLAVALGALQMMLDRGQQRDWFDSWEIWIELGLAIGAAWMFLVHMLTDDDPIFELKIFADRNFVTALAVMGAAGALMMGGLALLPPMLQGLMGYSVLQSGLLTAPRGIGTFISMIVAGRLAGRVDPRLMVGTGIALMALSLWQMSGFSLEMGRTPVVLSGLVQGLGMGLIFIPLNLLAFATLAPRFRTNGASLMNLMRSLGGSVGISVLVAMLARNLQVSHSDLAAQVTPASMPPVDPSLLSLLGNGGHALLAMLDAEINRQAAMIAYLDDFYLMMFVTLAALPLVLLLRKPPPLRPGPPPEPAE
jgi:DHA2 family multidrug resistance protein